MLDVPGPGGGGQQGADVHTPTSVMACTRSCTIPHAVLCCAAMTQLLCCSCTPPPSTCRLRRIFLDACMCTPSHACIHTLCCAAQVCSDDENLQLIHQGGLITLLKGCLDLRDPYANRDGPAAAIDTLTELWTRKAAEVSRDLYRRIEGEPTCCLACWLSACPAAG